jgi:hypothetical protein
LQFAKPHLLGSPILLWLAFRWRLLQFKGTEFLWPTDVRIPILPLLHIISTFFISTIHYKGVRYENLKEAWNFSKSNIRTFEYINIWISKYRNISIYKYINILFIMIFLFKKLYKSFCGTKVFISTWCMHIYIRLT